MPGQIHRKENIFRMCTLRKSTALDDLNSVHCHFRFGRCAWLSNIPL
jgi:hypothetical protein